MVRIYIIIFQRMRTKTVGPFRLRVLSGLAALACLTLPGCSSNQTIAITLTPPSTSTITINQGESQAVAASVSHDPSNQGVTWTLSGGGTLVNPTANSVTYQAPQTLNANLTASVTATSVANTSITASLSITVNSVLEITTSSLPVGSLGVPYSGAINASGSTGPFTWTKTSGNLPPGLTLGQSTSDSVIISGIPTALGTSTFTIEITDNNGNTASKSLSITINPPPPLSVATRSLSNGMVGVNYSQTLQAASGKPPYSWAITAGNLPPGLSLSGAVISGIPTMVGTSNFTVKVTDSTTPTPQTATADLSITINPSTVNNGNLDGNYAFLVSGFSPNGHFVAAGSFFADGAGNISNGVIDTNDPAGVQLAQSFSGTYAIGSNNLGTMSLGARSFALAMTSAGNAQIIEFDDQTGAGTRNSGVLLKQDTHAFSQALISGQYGFGFSGTDASADRYALVGSSQADGAGHFNSGVLDSDDNGVAQNVNFSGTYGSVNTSTGRGTATIAITGQGTTNYSFYVVSATQLLMMETDFVSGQVSPIVSGPMLQQSGPFGNSSFSGTGVLQTSAISGASAQSQAGLLSGDGGGNFNVSTDENTGGTMSSPLCNGTYSTPDSATGRTALTYSGTACAESVIYLTGENEGFVIGTDSNVTFGSMENQIGPFSNASLSGEYAGGSAAPVLPSAYTQIDIASADGVSNIDFTTDASTSAGLIQNQTSNGTYSLSNSRGTITVGGQTKIFYMVSSSEFVSLFEDTDATAEHFQQ